MSFINVVRCAAMSALSFLFITHLDAQSYRSHGPISHHERAHDKTVDDEYRMSHLDADAGDLIGLVLPRRIMDIHVTSAKWEVAESDLAKIVENSATSANVRLLAAGTTVVSYKYKYMDGPKEVSASYPFTIRIHRIDPEVLSLPSTIYLGWDLTDNISSKVQLLPKYSESPVSFVVDNPEVVDLVQNEYGVRLTGRRLGETTLFAESANGLRAEARIVVQVPALRDVDIVAPEKTMSVGETMQLSLKISPARAESHFKWSSEKPEVISVDEDGVVTAHSAGKATIRVVADNGEKDSISLKVK